MLVCGSWSSPRWQTRENLTCVVLTLFSYLWVSPQSYFPWSRDHGQRPCIETQLWGPQGHMGREFSMDGRHLESHRRFQLRRPRLGPSGREGDSRGWGWHLAGRKEGAVGNGFIFNYLLIIQELFSACLLCAQVGSSWDACPGSLWDRTLPP